MARYIEARSTDGLAVADSIRIAHLETYGGTLAAAAAAMVAYGSLSITDFKGSRHFRHYRRSGACSCAGLRRICCFPAWLVASERIRPLGTDGTWVASQRLRGMYGLPFAWVAGAQLLSACAQRVCRFCRRGMRGRTHAGSLFDPRPDGL